jgi:menaquinone-specific isochorismate synthase
LELICHALDGLIEEISLAPAYFSSMSLDIEESQHTPSQENWIALIEKTLGSIEGQAFEKVVMARRSTYLCNHPIHALELLSRMKAKGAIHFAVQFEKGSTFIGATPERLYRRNGRMLFTEAVAGTRKRGKTDEEDARLEKELLENQKERREFNFVKTSIEQALKPYSSTISSECEDTVLKTPNVQHLHNLFTAELDEGASDAEILSALHPTAAMGGLPKLSALEYLLQSEPFERGWYASPLGFISQSQAEFAVGIRSALIKENRLNLFAGTGIVAGSIPQNEWEELEHKTSLWRNLCKAAT